ncbi:MAG: DUF1036 domain-containing protein [Actinomycetota bacterium]|nr:DUF1036 domain-containing protein [Actinomycetota bacterium]
MMRFCNQTSAPIRLAFMWPQPGCMKDSDWQYAGWWLVSPGDCTVVYENDLSDQGEYWYFYAPGYEGEFGIQAPDTAFWRCEGESVGLVEEKTRQFREIFTGDNDDFTVNLA